MVRTTIGFVLLIVFAGVAPAHSELTAWDQAAVTAAAGELSTAAQELRDALRTQSPPTVGQPGRRAFFRLRDEMQALVSASGRLHRALEGGAGQEETFPTYQRLLSTARRAERETRSIGLGEPVTSKIAAAADAIRRIRPYYEDAPSL